jgi:predicted MFS family arabinose efflux permease
MGGPCVSTDAVFNASPQETFPGIGRSWWPMLLLFLAAILYSVDKAIVGVLAEPIRGDLGLTDVQMSLLLGLAYTLLSGLCGLWLGSLIDRHTRCRVLAAAIIIWSLSTAIGGLSRNFETFFAFRALVGLGEAAVAPAAMSLIADMFAPSQRGRALSAYLMGATLGTALSSIVPGMILRAGLHLSLPGYGLVVPWRSAFLICGLIGPVIGLLFLTVREPVRRGVVRSKPGGVRVGDKLRFLWRSRGVFAPLLIGFCLFYVAFIGLTAWISAFLMRRYDLLLQDFANAMGLAMMASGFAGYLLGGFAADSRLARGPAGRLTLMMLLPLVALPSAFADFAPSANLALIAIATITFATPILNVAMNATVQDLVPNDMRGFSYALVAVVSALPAGVGGPLVIAFVTEHVLFNHDLIGRSILFVCLPALLAASLAFALARRATLRRHASGVATRPL